MVQHTAHRSAPKRVLGFATVLLLLGLAGLAGWWAAQQTLPSRTTSEQVHDPNDEIVWAKATKSSVGRSLPLSTTLHQPARAVANNWLSGVVTDVGGGEIAVGDALYAVAGVPVRAIEGKVPFYRDLASGAKGDDVVQLQRALISLGYLTGTADGDFGRTTANAVKAWQGELGLTKTGGVSHGEVIAVPKLPTVVQLGEAIVLGDGLSSGEEAVLAPTGEQDFTVVATQEQARMIPAGSPVEVTFENFTWQAVISSSAPDEAGGIEFTLAGADGGAVCGEDCSALPGDEKVTLSSKIIVVAPVEGVGVPAAAVHTRADGTAYVVLPSGEKDVQVRGSGQGIVIIEGVDEGTKVRVLGAGPPIPQGPGAGEPGTDEPTVEDVSEPSPSDDLP